VGAAFLEVPPADRDVPGVAADLDLRTLAHPRFCGDRKNMSPNRRSDSNRRTLSGQQPSNT
jgi:hypothetical protein